MRGHGKGREGKEGEKATLGSIVIMRGLEERKVNSKMRVLVWGRRRRRR